MQYVDVRDLAEWMVRLIEGDAAGTFNVVGPAARQTLVAVHRRARAAGRRADSYTWIEDYAWLKALPAAPAERRTTPPG